ncbi:MAG TPA: class I SAM-dependent methyltransferase [Phototrophicaceae bacterium]|nr:class I SAM-dependent methyltransferase [Phototrophicaceae bacterium]
MQQHWPVQLFNKSRLKQRKYQEITALLGNFDGLHCLDIGSDNGVISYLLRQQGGIWKSADLEKLTVDSIRELVQTDVYQINGQETPFADNEFDVVVIVDFLEHIPDDRAFVTELYRILKPGGTLIINVPHLKNSLLRRFRYALGQTDEKHGHLRPGYTIETIRQLLSDRFAVDTSKTYSKFFSEWIDTLIVWTVNLAKGGQANASKKGLVITGNDLKNYQKMFRLYSLIYPVVWLFSKLDTLLFFSTGYVLIVKAHSNKSPVAVMVHAEREIQV